MARQGEISPERGGSEYSSGFPRQEVPFALRRLHPFAVHVVGPMRDYSKAAYNIIYIILYVYIIQALILAALLGHTIRHALP